MKVHRFGFIASDQAAINSVCHPFILGSIQSRTPEGDPISLSVPIWLELFKLPLNIHELERRAMETGATIPKHQTMQSWAELPRQRIPCGAGEARVVLAKLVPWPTLIDQYPSMAVGKPALAVEEFCGHALVGVVPEELTT